MGGIAMSKTMVTSRFLMPAAMLFVAVLSASAIGAPAGGQRQMRNLSGHVLDHHDDPLAKAVVYLKNTKTLAVKTYISDADGTYRERLGVLWMGREAMSKLSALSIRAPM